MSRAARGRVSPGTDERRASIDDARRDFAKSPAGKTLGLRAVALQSPSETHLLALGKFGGKYNRCALSFVSQ